MAASKKLISSTFIETIYKSRLVLIDYLKKEKYDCDDYDEFSINEISAMVANSQLDLLLSNEINKIYVKYHLEKTLRPSVLHDIIDELYKYYIPCKSKKYLVDLSEKKCITILRQFLKIHNHTLISKEKYVKGKKNLFYQVIPSQIDMLTKNRTSDKVVISFD